MDVASSATGGFILGQSTAELKAGERAGYMAVAGSFYSFSDVDLFMAKKSLGASPSSTVVWTGKTKRPVGSILPS